MGGEATVYVTLTLTANVLLFTEARCLCGHRVMMTPGVALIEVRRVASNAASSGRGRVVECRSCSSLLEILERDSSR